MNDLQTTMLEAIREIEELGFFVSYDIDRMQFFGFDIGETQDGVFYIYARVTNYLQLIDIDYSIHPTILKMLSIALSEHWKNYLKTISSKAVNN